MVQTPGINHDMALDADLGKCLSLHKVPGESLTTLAHALRLDDTGTG